jgi:hypothetical protein
MPHADVYMKQGDTKPDLELTFLDGNGSAVDLTGATVVFSMRRAGTVVISEQACTLVTAASGEAKYVWQAGDTDTAGVYEGEAEVTFSGGGVETWPNSKHIRIEITPQIA